MHVQGKWDFKQEDPQTISNHLFNPASLIRLIPDIHHVIKKSPDHIVCVLQPQIAVLEVEELHLDIVRQPGGTAERFDFNLIMRGQGQTVLTGHGAISLTRLDEGSCLTYEITAEQTGHFLQFGQLFLETQLRAGLRRFFTNLETVLSGRIPASITHIAPRDTSKEMFVVIVGLVAFIIGWILWRQWLSRK